MSKLNNTGSNSIAYDKNFDFNITVGTQTDEIKPYDYADKVESTGMSTQTEELVLNNNNNVQLQCLECEKMSRYAEKLEMDINRSHRAMSEMQGEIENYEGNLDMLEQFVKEGNERNNVLQAIIKSLEMKISLLEVACAKQGDRLASLAPDCYVCTQTQSGTLCHCYLCHRLYIILDGFKNTANILVKVLTIIDFLYKSMFQNVINIL